MPLAASWCIGDTDTLSASITDLLYFACISMAAAASEPYANTNKHVSTQSSYKTMSRHGGDDTIESIYDANKMNIQNNAPNKHIQTKHTSTYTQTQLGLFGCSS